MEFRCYGVAAVSKCLVIYKLLLIIKHPTYLKLVSISFDPGFLNQRPNDYSSLVLQSENYYVDGQKIPDLDTNSYLSVKIPEHIIVQSDKAKYKPGNLVQFRVLTVNEDLAGLPASVSYKIQECVNLYNLMVKATFLNSVFLTFLTVAF